MLKYIQTFVCVAVIAAFAVSCQSGNSDVREAARENVENQVCSACGSASKLLKLLNLLFLLVLPQAFPLLKPLLISVL